MDVDQLVGQARERERRPMPARERIVAAVLAAAFLAGAALIAALVPVNRSVDIPLIAGLTLLFAVARSIRFEIGNAEASPDQLVFVPLLLLAPLPLVPLLTAAAFLLARIPDFARGRMHPDRWLYPLGDAWYSIGPVAVVAALAPATPQIGDAWVYGLAVGAQVVSGLVFILVNDYLIHGAPPREALPLAFEAWRIDVVLTPVALAVAAVAQREPVAVLGIVPLMWLLQVFSRERRERFAAALELNQAYRGTVMVLSDVVEAEDNYTASHCRSVVELAAAVADELGLDHSTKQELEIAALLHDVGKIAIPNEILNKPSKLTDEEFDLMKTHTVEGQALLDRVGGRLAKVGRIVRSCHERWDGRGYPDGLAGDEIPVAARVVFCCDAYSAMTTDRPYRRAMRPEAALEELRTNSGTQFEPRVVEAMERVVARDVAVGTTDQYADALRALLAGNAAAAVELPA